MIFEMPPILRGDEAQQISSIRDYLVRLVKSLGNGSSTTILRETNKTNEDAGCNLIFSSVSVPANTFALQENPTYPDFPYRAEVNLDGAEESMVPYVVLPPAVVLDGNIAPVSESYSGGIYLYAAEVPEDGMLVPTIVLFRGGTN